MINSLIVDIYLLCGAAWVSWRASVNHAKIEKELSRSFFLPAWANNVAMAIAATMAVISWPTGVIKHIWGKTND